MISRPQTIACESLFGVPVKIFRRLGVSETPLIAIGPVIARSRRCGSVVKPYASAMLVLASDQSSGAIRS